MNLSRISGYWAVYWTWLFQDQKSQFAGTAKGLSSDSKVSVTLPWESFTLWWTEKQQEFASQKLLKMNVFADVLWTICSMISVNLNLRTRTGRRNKKGKTREEKLLKENEKLEQYVKRLEKFDGDAKAGKDLSAMSAWNHWVAVHERTENRAQKALWFLEQFGLKILTLEVEQKDGCTRTQT